MKKLFSTLMLCMGLTLYAYSQTILVKGQITDQQETSGVAFALVKINNHYTYTDESGFFSIEVPQTDLVRLEASQLGYESQTLEIGENQDNIRLALVPRIYSLEELLIEGQSAHSQPQSDIFIDPPKAITQPRDVGDLFNDLPGFSLIKRGGFALDPVYRSFKFEQLNVIYDGGMQTTYACPGRMDPTTTHINPQDVEKIELIRGPFSVRYGPTMGAIINVVTHPLGQQEHTRIGGTVETGYESNGGSKVAKMSLAGGRDRFDFALHAGLKDYGNYLSGDGTEVPSSFRSYDYTFKAGYRPAENHQIQLNWRQAFNRDVLHAGLPMDTDTDDSDFLSIDYQWKNLGGTINGLTVKAYSTQVDHLMINTRRPNFGMVEATAAVRAETYGGKAELSMQPSKKTWLYAGVDYRLIGREGDRVRLMKRNMMTGEELSEPRRMVDAIWQDAQIQSAGLFLENKYFFHPQWTWVLGARLDRVEGQIGSPAADFTALYDNLEADVQWNVSPTTSISYYADSDWKLQLALGRGVRSPNMIERYINHFTVGQDLYEYVGNPHLRPEINNQLEISWQKQSDQLHLNWNVFYSDLRDYITAEVDTDLPRKFMGSLANARRFVNIDRAIQMGTEFSAQWKFHSFWKLSSSLAYTHAENKDWDEPLAEIAPLQAQLGLQYERTMWWASTQATLVDQQDRVSQRFNENTTPGYAVVDLRAGIEPMEGLSVGVAVLNLLDKQYRAHLNRAYRNASVPGIVFDPGRNVTFFAKYQF